MVIWTDAYIRIGEIAADGFPPLFQQVVGSEQAEKAVLQAMFLAYEVILISGHVHGVIENGLTGAHIGLKDYADK